MLSFGFVFGLVTPNGERTLKGQRVSSGGQVPLVGVWVI